MCHVIVIVLERDEKFILFLIIALAVNLKRA